MSPILAKGTITTDSGSTPLLSIVLFVRNAATTVDFALRSVVENDYPNFELIVLDGGSTDGTQEVLQRYRDFISHWHSGPDGGPVVAINRGVELAQGEVVCLLAGDDWFEPNSLSVMMQRFTAEPGLDLLSCGACTARVSGSRISYHSCYSKRKYLELSVNNVVRNSITHARILRKRAYHKVGPYDTTYRIAADQDFLLRACFAGLTTGILEHRLYNYREHPLSATFSRNPATIVPLLREEITITETYMRRSALDAADYYALRTLHAGATTSLIVRMLRSGDVRHAGQLAATAFEANSLWPLYALVWYGPVVYRKVRKVLNLLAGSILPGRHVTH